MWFWLKKQFSAWCKKTVYLDYASTTPIDDRVLSVMDEVYKNTYGNPGGMYPLGVQVKQHIEQSRKKVKQLLGVNQGDIIFTRGGTESDNMAIIGVVQKYREQFPGVMPHIITSTIEHDAVLQTCRFLEQQNLAAVTYIPCDDQGIIPVDAIKKALTETTVLITIMYVNNEIGTIQPIKEIAKLVRWYKKHYKEPGAVYPLVHTDAVQAVNYLDSNVTRLGIDLMTCSGSKIYGPKSSGILYVKNKDSIVPMFFGGDQELGLRSGTPDVASIIGFTKALEISLERKQSESERLMLLRDWLIHELQKNPAVTLNGSQTERLPNNVNISVAGITGESLVIQLGAKGFAVSAKSACQSEKDEESHVIKALRDAQGVARNSEEGSLRISLGRYTTKKDLQRFLKVFKQITQ
jgi:cysteine desulfurase